MRTTRNPWNVFHETFKLWLDRRDETSTTHTYDWGCAVAMLLFRETSLAQGNGAARKSGLSLSTRVNVFDKGICSHNSGTQWLYRLSILSMCPHSFSCVYFGESWGWLAASMRSHKIEMGMETANEQKRGRRYSSVPFTISLIISRRIIMNGSKCF